MGAGSGAIRAGRAFVEIFTDTNPLEKGLRGVEGKLTRFGSQVARIGLSMAGFGASAATGLLAAAKQFSDAGDELAKSAVRMGIGVQALTELRFAADQSGVSAEALEKAILGLNKVLLAAEGGSAAAQKKLADLGLSLGDLAGLAPEEQFAKLSDALLRVEEPGRRAAMAMALFGRSGAELLPLLNEGSAGIEALRQKARDFGITLTEEDVKAAEQLNDAIGLLTMSFKARLGSAMAALTPTLTEFAEKVAESMKSVGDFIHQHRELVTVAFKASVAVAGVGTALFGIGAACNVAATGIAAVRSATALLAANLPMLGVAIAAASIYLIGKHALDSVNGVNELNRALEEQARLLGLTNRSRDRRQQEVFDKAEDIEDPKARAEFLRAEIERAEKNAAGLRSSAAGAQKLADRTRQAHESASWIDQRRGWTNGVVGTNEDGSPMFGEIAIGEPQVQQQQRMADQVGLDADAAESFVDRLKEALRATERGEKAAQAPQQNEESPATVDPIATLKSLIGGLPAQLQTIGENLGLIEERMSVGDWLRSLIPDGAGIERPEDRELDEQAESGFAGFNNAAHVGSQEGFDALYKAMHTIPKPDERQVEEQKKTNHHLAAIERAMKKAPVVAALKT